MAITIAGQGGNHNWLGVAPDVKILPVVHEGSTQTAAIKWAVDHGAGVINISEGSPNSCSDDLQQAIAYAADHQVVVIAAAGNEGQSKNSAEYPGDCAGVLAVGAIQPDLSPWPGSERQPYVAVSAPGSQIGLIGSDGLLYHNSWGTSISTAFTSGLAALIRSRYPHLTARQVVQRIIATVHPLPGAVPDPATGYGAIRFTRALTAAVPANAPNPVYDALDQWRAAHAAAPPSDLGTAGPVAATPSPSHSTSAAMKILLDGGIFVLALLAAFGVRSLVRRNRRPVPPPPRNGPPGMPPSFGGGDPDRHLHN
jgi:subtilisin family serine protease